MAKHNGLGMDIADGLGLAFRPTKPPLCCWWASQPSPEVAKVLWSPQSFWLDPGLFLLDLERDELGAYTVERAFVHHYQSWVELQCQNPNCKHIWRATFEGRGIARKADRMYPTCKNVALLPAWPQEDCWLRWTRR